MRLKEQFFFSILYCWGGGRVLSAIMKYVTSSVHIYCICNIYACLVMSGEWKWPVAIFHSGFSIWWHHPWLPLPFFFSLSPSFSAGCLDRIIRLVTSAPIPGLMWPSAPVLIVSPSRVAPHQIRPHYLFTSILFIYIFTFYSLSFFASIFLSFFLSFQRGGVSISSRLIYLFVCY